MNVSLTEHYHKFIQDKVDSGKYHSASEVIREALRLLEEQDILKKIREDELRKAIKEARDSGSPSPWNVNEFLEKAHKKADKLEAK